MRNYHSYRIPLAPVTILTPRKLSYSFIFQSLEVVSRYRDTQLQVTEKLCDLWNLSRNICQGFKIEGVFYF